MKRTSKGETEFKDHFSGHAGDYARYRPGYPAELFDWLASVAPATDTAWDAACGNGQAALGLAGHYRHVAASDASFEQVRRAGAHPSVSYFAARAEASGLAEGSVDLITVAQAAHWFHMPSFAREARRVARSRGVVAAWCYGLAQIAPAIDRTVEAFYEGTLGPYWPPERELIDGAYRALHFPFPEVEAPTFEMVSSWTLECFLAYLGTWSAYRRYLDHGHDDPLPELKTRLTGPWGDGERRVRWPLHVRAGILNG